MKVAIFFTAVLIGAFAQAEDPTIAPFVCDSSNAFLCTLKELGHNIKHHATTLGGKLKDVGTSILTAATEQGKNLLVSGGQAVLGTVLEHLNKSGIVGKRDIAFFDKLREGVQKGAEFLKKVKAGLETSFKKAVDKITGVMKDNAALKMVENMNEKLDSCVAEFKKEGKAGFAAMAAGVKENLKKMFNAAMDKLKDHFAQKDKRALLSDLLEKAKGHFSNLAGSLADTFKPHLDALKQGLTGLGNKAKEHAGKLVDAAKDSFNDLKDKLSGHIETLKGHAATLGSHASNALNALKEAVTSIANQALSNAKGTLSDAAKTGVDAVKVVGDHVNGN